MPRAGLGSLGPLPQMNRSLPPTYAWARKGKGYLMPRRRYGGVEELRRAVAVAMGRLREQMGQVVLQSLCVGT